MIANLIYISVGIAALIGLGVAVWSYIDTRQKYYNDYIGRRSQ
jgi:uncharacterized membrane protein YuzA (DUF378 family)